MIFLFLSCMFNMEDLETCISNLSLKDEDEMYFIDIAQKLKSNVSGKIRCQQEQDTLKKCLLCKYYLSSNEWSVLMEKHVKTLFSLQKCIDSTSGDGCTKNKLNVEIKVSLGTKDGTMNFVQLRPDHKLDFYILVAFDIHENLYGRLYWFLCKPDELYKLIPEYGGYAHGSVDKLGRITEDNIKGRNCEYALRPNPRKKGKSNMLWNIMIERFLSSEEKIKMFLQ